MHKHTLTTTGFALALILEVVLAVPAHAQLAKLGPNQSASMGHLHIRVKDAEAAKKFFIELGGHMIKNGGLELVEFPGIYIQIRQMEPSGGTVGSVVNHVGFLVKDRAATAAKLEAAGYKVDKPASGGQYHVTTPDGLNIELIENRDIAAAIQFEHVHFAFQAEVIPDVQAWYERAFAATPGTRGRFKAGTVAGGILTYGEAKEKQEGTRGRALDHIGFEVPDLQGTFARLQALGIKFDAEPKVVNNGLTKNAFLTDPWGTYIELTEGIGPK
jgi:catechol 2,3-dioxygenase-like lactoylglutathione lyase family enzyme